MKIKRIITKDYENNCLIIKGDYAPSSITIFVIRKIFGEKDYGYYLTEESAKDMATFLNKEYHTNTFIITERTLFTR